MQSLSSGVEQFHRREFHTFAKNVAAILNA
jgi:hypothetical protein